MLTDKQIAAALDLIDERYHAVITKYLQKVGKTIKDIGHLNASSVNLLIQLRRMGVDVQTIERELKKVTRLTKQDIRTLYRKAAQESTSESRIEYLTKGVEPDSVRWESLVEDIWRQTAGAMDNLSNSSVITAGYREAIDDAVQAVTMGAGDYNSVIRETVKRIGRAGIQVEYNSTYLAADGQLKHRKRRLDSAVRQNVLDGIRQVQQKAQELIGEEIGADGVDISAHPNSAPDHEPVQGRRFDLTNFQKMQSAQSFSDVDGHHYVGFERPITQWRCRHLVFYILLGVTRRMYTDEQLKSWEAENQKGCVIDGKEYTNYQATQLMRRIETEIRRQKDIAILAKESGDDVLRRECQSNINQLTKKYNQVAETAGLRKQMQRTKVEGFTPVELHKKLEIKNATGRSSRQRVEPAFIDVTNNWYPDSTPNSHPVMDLQEYTINGVTYKVDGRNVQLDYKPCEKEIAELLAREVGGEVYMVPRVNNPQGISTPDYLFNGKAYDLKTLSKDATENTIFNRIKKARNQAHNFIIDISASSLNDEMIENQIKKVFENKSTTFVDEVVIIKNGRIKTVVKRKKS